MAEARALFAKHIKQFGDFIFSIGEGDRPSARDTSTIYAACIIAEAIRNEQEDFDAEVKIPKTE